MGNTACKNESCRPYLLSFDVFIDKNWYYYRNFIFQGIGWGFVNDVDNVPWISALQK